jgi:hypothetical protein
MSKQTGKFNAFEHLKKLLESHNVDDLNLIVDIVGRTKFTKTIGIHYDTFRKRLKNPEKFTIKHIQRLAALLEVDPRLIANLIIDLLETKTKKSTKK